MLQAGTSVVTITPPLGTPMAGFFHYREAKTVADDLTARTLVLDDGTNRLAIVICDLISLRADIVAAIRNRIERMLGIPAEHVLIACTHTHTGPVTIPHRNVQPDQAYMNWLVMSVADGVGIAVTRLVPARIAHGTSEVNGVCFNRRYHMRDGTVVFNPGIGNPDVIEPAGPVDPQVAALLVEDENGRPLAVWACLSTHYVGTDDELALSADYYGDFDRSISRCLGDQCVGILANGTSGNINTIDIQQSLKVRGTARARLTGTAVAAAAIQAVMTRRRHSDAKLEGKSLPFTAHRWPVTQADVDTAQRILATPTGSEPIAKPQFSYVVGQTIPTDLVWPYAGDILKLAQLPETAASEIQIMRIGNFSIAALPGEIFVEFGLALKARSPFGTTAVVGLSNDNIGYVPTTEAFEQGGYETWRTSTSWTAPGTGEEMTRIAGEQLQEFANRSPAVAQGQMH